MFTSRPSLALLLTLGSALSFASVSVRVDGAERPRGPDALSGEVVTLRSLDDLTATFGFSTNDHGYVVERGEIRNRISHIAFDRWAEDALVVGIQGRSRGVIKDIGDVRTDGTKMSVLPALVRDGARVLCQTRERSGFPRDGIAVDEESKAAATARVELGHLYLLRLDDEDATYFVALRVVEHHPGQAVTFRWRML
ncbi:MAG: hypothetical protein R3F56_20030 [Planctomycetota bacterium]